MQLYLRTYPLNILTNSLNWAAKEIGSILKFDVMTETGYCKHNVIKTFTFPPKTKQNKKI